MLEGVSDIVRCSTLSSCNFKRKIIPCSLTTFYLISVLRFCFQNNNVSIFYACILRIGFVSALVFVKVMFVMDSLDTSAFHIHTYFSIFFIS